MYHTSIQLDYNTGYYLHIETDFQLGATTLKPAMFGRREDQD